MSNTLTISRTAQHEARVGNKLGQLLRAVDAKPTIATYCQVAESLKKYSGFAREARLAMLSTFTIDTLSPFIEVEAIERSM